MTLEDLAQLRRACDLMDREYARPLDVPACYAKTVTRPSRIREAVVASPA